MTGCKFSGSAHFIVSSAVCTTLSLETRKRSEFRYLVLTWSRFSRAGLDDVRDGDSPPVSEIVGLRCAVMWEDPHHDFWSREREACKD
ncbi:hypothetical protein RRG08_036941 [Elysia crispata]|uniref:Uncharacterized protein n=1 Tax=Elysia crispata TaxID=231223 RepID=A0AAE0ZJ55_9GAST|nr:hypothetical protein RRG08_036941 [Elysia crispata]